MDDFADVSRARASYKTFSEAMAAGREILRKAGVPDPPPVPPFDVVYKRLDAEAREDLYAQLRSGEEMSAPDTIRLWTPLIKRAFGVPSKQ